MKNAATILCLLCFTGCSFVSRAFSRGGLKAFEVALSNVQTPNSHCHLYSLWAKRLLANAALSACDITDWNEAAQNVRAVIVSSDAFFRSSPSLIGSSESPSNYTFIKAAFKELLGRLPSDNDVSAYYGYIQHEMQKGGGINSARYKVARILSWSLEAASREVTVEWPSDFGIVIPSSEVDGWILRALSEPRDVTMAALVASQGANSSLGRSPCAITPSANDASSIQSCLDQTPSGGEAILPPLQFVIGKQIKIDHPLTLRTLGSSFSSGTCSGEVAECAALQASAAFNDSLGILFTSSSSVTLRNIVIDGNKDLRTTTKNSSCMYYGDSARGYNAHFDSGLSDIVVDRVLSKNAPCGTGMDIGAVSKLRVTSSAFQNNGTHSCGLLSDGLTIKDVDHGIIINNTFHDNSDVDLILGGCRNCTIAENHIVHTGAPLANANAGLMIQAWPSFCGGEGTSGDYSNSWIYRNTIDLGPSDNIALPLLVGSCPWYVAPVAAPSGGATVTLNTLLNWSAPMNGIVLSNNVSGVAVSGNNVLVGSAPACPAPPTSCAPPTFPVCPNPS